jgi:uncharacterized RDD family membrane protein YckC
VNPTEVVGRRVAAIVIDAVIGSAISAGILFGTTKSSGTTCAFTPKAVAYKGVGIELGNNCHYWPSAGRFGAYIALVIVVPFILYWVLPALTGATPGKAIVGIRIIRRDGRHPGFWKVFVRQFMFIVDAFPYFIPYLTGFLVANGDKEEHKRIGDRVAGTLVVDKSAAGQPFTPPQQQFATSPQAFNAGPSGPPQAQPQPQPVQPSGSPAPGWYDDPQREARLRYWDGSSWTSHTSG